MYLMVEIHQRQNIPSVILTFKSLKSYKSKILTTKNFQKKKKNLTTSLDLFVVMLCVFLY